MSLKNADDGENKRLNDKFEILNIELKTLLDDGAKQRQRTRIKGLLDEVYTTLRSSREENRKANDEYCTAVREARKKRKKKECLEKIQYEADKRQEAARQELELASLPAFDHEIDLCDTLGVFLQTFTKSGSSSSVAVSASAHTTIPVNNAPEGFVSKKRDVDEVYFMRSNNNNKKKGNNNIITKEKKSDTLNCPYLQWKTFSR